MSGPQLPPNWQRQPQQVFMQQPGSQPPPNWQGQPQQVFMQQPGAHAQPPPNWQGQPQPGFMQQPGPAGVGYYPHFQPGMPQMVVGAPVQRRPPKYEYTPQDFRTLSWLTIVFCGLFSPISLLFSIPALLFSRKSQASAKAGSIKVARSQGVLSAYFNIAAILLALVTATVLTGLVIGIYGKAWSFNTCLGKAEAASGFPPLNDNSDDDMYGQGSPVSPRSVYYRC